MITPGEYRMVCAITQPKVSIARNRYWDAVWVVLEGPHFGLVVHQPLIDEPDHQGRWVWEEVCERPAELVGQQVKGVLSEDEYNGLKRPRVGKLSPITEPRTVEIEVHRRRGPTVKIDDKAMPLAEWIHSVERRLA